MEGMDESDKIILDEEGGGGVLCPVSDTTKEPGRWEPTEREDKRTRPASVRWDQMRRKSMWVYGKMEEAVERRGKEKAIADELRWLIPGIASGNCFGIWQEQLLKNSKSCPALLPLAPSLTWNLTAAAVTVLKCCVVSSSLALMAPNGSLLTGQPQ